MNQFARVIFSILIICTMSAGAYASARTQVIVIGAGISGLAAAKELRKHNTSVLVLEARDRIGGRIQTVWPWGKALDLGATWIHGVDNNPIAKIAEELHIKTVPTVYNDHILANKFKSYVLYTEEGLRIPDNTVQSISADITKFEDFLSRFIYLFRSVSVGDVYEIFKLTEKPSNIELLTFMINNAYINEYAVNIENLSAFADYQYESSTVTGDNVLFPDGYSQIIKALSDGVNVELEQVVKQVNYNADGVEIVTDKGRFSADYAIVSVPLGVLKSRSITFNPNLPVMKLKAINHLNMGLYNKIYLHFSYPFWDKQYEWIGIIPANNEPGLWDIFNLAQFDSEPDLLVFTGGRFAEQVEKWSDKETINQIMMSLRKLYGQHIPDPESYVITRWKADPYSRGSYSYMPVKALASDYKQLAAPVANKLYFAGEATSTTDPATVHGAYLSGIRAATEVMQDIQLKRKQPAFAH